VRWWEPTSTSKNYSGVSPTPTPAENTAEDAPDQPSKAEIRNIRIMNKFKIRTYSKIEQNYNLANSKSEQIQKLNKFII
jgi:hypothetical protein